MQLPVATVRAKQRAERSELKPPRIQFTGVLLRRNKAANVRAPIRNAAQACVDGIGHVSLQRLPLGEHIARPKKRRIALHTCVGISMQCIDSLIRPI